MRKRIGFTLIELLIVMAIILTMASILLVTVNHVRRVAAIDGEKLDFQAIEAGLENYRNDFGSYPKNIQLTTWNTANGAAPQFLTLATALMGPGPGAPQTLGTSQTYTAGDGADGPGFRTQTMNIPVTISGTNLTFLTPVPSIATLPPQSAWWLDYQPGTPQAQHVGITGATLTGTGPITGVTVTTWSPTAGPTVGSTTLGVLRIATGRIWGPYLPPEKFQVAYIDPTRTGVATDVANNIHYPVLLDRWGGEIQYFPAYGPTNNRAGTTTTPGASSYMGNYSTLSLTAPMTPISAGPLFGFATPNSIDSTTPTLKAPSGFYSIFDQRDGAPIIDTLSPLGPEAIPWYFYSYMNPRPSGQTTTDLSKAVKWMLGDDNFNDVIDSGENLRDPQPYILISAGPDGPTRANGGFCDFSQIPATTDSGVYQKVFTASGNIYNFDR